MNKAFATSNKFLKWLTREDGTHNLRSQNNALATKD